MNTPDQLAEQVLEACRMHGYKLATAESCTVGMVIAALTDIPGSSDVVDRGFVTYSNDAKEQLIGVAAQTLKAHGAVSEQTAREMAAGARHAARVDIAVAITGVAGPDGGTRDKPVGLVHFACAHPSGDTAHREYRFGPLTRAEIRSESVVVALEMLLKGATVQATP